jgi:hypothetical protein
MNFPKTLLLLVVLNLTVATEFACAATIQPPAASKQPAAVPAGAPVLAAPSSSPAPASARSAGAPEDIRDIRGPISIPYGWLWAAYLAGAVALAAAIYGGWQWYCRRAAERAKLPHEIALERLERARALMTESQAREYSFAVSEITRRYIEARFHERAARRTTEEFFHDLLAQTDTPLANHRGQLEDVLNHCDLAKFARWQLSVPDMEAMHASARAFILETRPADRGEAPADGTRENVDPRPTEAQLTHS